MHPQTTTTLTATEITQTGLSTKTTLDRSIFASNGMHLLNFASLGIFMHQEHRTQR